MGFIIDAAAKLGDGGQSIGDSQPGDGNVFARGNVKHAAGFVGVHGQLIRTGTADGGALVHDQLATGERDGLAVQRRIEVNHVNRRLHPRARDAVNPRHCRWCW